MKKVKIFIFSLIFIVSCDVPATLEIKNELDKSLVFSYSFKNDKKLCKKIKVLPNEKKYIPIGFDTRWNDSFLNKFALKELDTIYLNIKNDKYFCSSEQCKKQLFNRIHIKSRRRFMIRINSNVVLNTFEKR